MQQLAKLWRILAELIDLIGKEEDEVLWIDGHGMDDI